MKIVCGSASDSLYLTFKGGCRKDVPFEDLYRCTGCGGKFHKDCILEHFKLEKDQDWGRQQERVELINRFQAIIEEAKDTATPLIYIEKKVKEL